jgi:predicted RNA-binding Zn-ribbon protein involved in translation (DUF1610 family)
MARECPSCGKVIPVRGIVVRRVRNGKISWFRFVPSQFFCPHCGVRIRPLSRPLGRMLLATMVVVYIIPFLAMIGAIPMFLPFQNVWFLYIINGVGFVLILSYVKWGHSFVVVKGSSPY